MNNIETNTPALSQPILSAGVAQEIPQWERSVPLCPFDSEIIEAMQAEITAWRSAALASAPAAPIDRVTLPTNADQAAGMVLLGTQWLEQNAPERLSDQGLASMSADAQSKGGE